MIETYLLEYFIAVIENKSLLKASEVLHISQPSLTRAIQKLEEELSLTLFTRERNRLILNSQGKIIEEYARDLLSLERRLEEKAKELKESENSLRIGLSAPGPLFRYSSILLSNAKYQKVITTIEEEKALIAKVKNGLLDLAFITEDYQDDELLTQHIMDEHLYISLPKTHFLSNAKKGLYFHDVDGQSFLLAKELGVWDKILEEELPNSRLFRQDLDNLDEIVSASSIPSFVTDVTIEDHRSSDRVFLPFLDDKATISFYIIIKKKNSSLLKNLKLNGN